MSITDQGVYKELQELIAATPRKVHWGLEANLYVSGLRVQVMSVIRQQVSMDFATRYYGDNFVTLQVDPVVYRHMVKFKNDLSIEMVKRQQGDNGEEFQATTRKSQRFKAFLLNAHDEAIIASLNKHERNDGTVVQASRLIDIHLQLIDPYMEDYRLREVGGVYPNLTMYQFIKYIMGHGLGEEVDVPTVSEHDYPWIRGVDIIDCDNTKVYDQIVVPAGTRLYKLPEFLQKEYGVYNTGMGWHYYRGWCFIYPLLNYTLFPKREKTMTIVNIPEAEIPSMERTFLYRSKHLYVFATGDSGNKDTTEHLQQVHGVGRRFVSADNALDTFATTDANVTTINRTENEKSYIVEERPDGIPNVKMLPERFTNNPYRVSSELSQSLGTTVVLQWHRAAPELLYPGMPVKFMFKDGEVMVTLEATLMGVSYVSSPASSLATDNHFITTATLTLFVQRRDLV